jgi:GcrA cell cycle regulator
MSWTEERIDRLKKMWHDGATASQIADELGGVSRNAVIGKAHRLDSNGVLPRSRRAKEAESAAAEAPKPAAPKSDAPKAAPVTSPVQSTEPRRPLQSEIQYRSIGPGGFIRQGPGEQQAPIPPAPPRRLVPAKPSPEVADKTSLLDLNDRICKWPIGHPGEPDFYFCGQQANPGFPYCVQHASPTRRSSRRDRPPPPLPSVARVR